MTRCLPLGLGPTLGVGLALGSALFSPVARAAPPSSGPAAATDSARGEARVRFDRGLALFEKEHDAPAALAELLRAYELVPAPRTLFVMGLVYAAMNRPLDALHAFDEVVRRPGDLTAAQRDVARARRDEQKQKVGFVRIDSNVPANVQIDGLPRGHTPLEVDLPVAAGLRVITLEAPGYLTARRETLVAGEATVPVSLELEPAVPASPRLVRVRTNVPDTEILVDGVGVGRTPLDRPLALDRRPHVIGARRPCYAPAARPLAAGPPAESAPSPTPEELSLRLAIAGGACPQGRLTLAVSEPGASVAIDEEPMVAAVPGPLALPAGRHDVLVTRAGFVPSRIPVEVPADHDVSASVVLVPTPETRAAFEERALSSRRWGRALVIAGGAVALAGGVLTAVEWKKVGDAQGDRDRVLATFDSGRSCDPFVVINFMVCQDTLDAANARVRRAELWRGLAIATGAVGLAALAAGAVIWGAAPDAHRYDRPGAANTFGAARRSPRRDDWRLTVYPGGIAGAF